MSKLTAERRNALPAKTFAGPDRIKAKIRAKVHAKFPGIKQYDQG